MNPPFGPFHPPELQSSVNHAERVAALLTRLRATPEDDEASAWLAGRVDEIEAVVVLAAREVLEGESAARAARRLDAYIETLHAGLAHHFPQAVRACCGLEYATTEVDVTLDVDPGDLLAGLPESCPTPR